MTPAPPKIRVLETIRQGAIGGGESHVLSLVSALDPSRFEPVVLSFTEGAMVEELRARHVPVHVIPTERPFDITKWQQVKQLMQRERIDLVHAHGTRAQSNTYWAARQLGLPVLYTVHGWSFHVDQPAWLRISRQLGERVLMRYADVTISVSESNRQDGLKFSDMRNAVVVRYGIDLAVFDPREPIGPGPGLRAELGIGPATVIVGSLVRMTIQKDPLTLIRAMAALPADLDVVCLMIGEGDLRPAAEQLVRELDLGSRVRFLPFRQDVAYVLQGLDIYCLPSLWEGLPIGLLEAMAMGKAVVATAIDGTREAVKSGVNGLLIAPQSPGQLAEALRLLATDANYRRELGQEAYRTVQEQFGVDTMTRRVEQLYLQLSGARRGTVQPSTPAPAPSVSNSISA